MWGIERDFLGKWDWTRGKGDEVVNAIQGVESGWGGHSRQVGAMDWAVDQVCLSHRFFREMNTDPNFRRSRQVQMIIQVAYGGRIRVFCSR